MQPLRRLHSSNHHSVPADPTQKPRILPNRCQPLLQPLLALPALATIQSRPTAAVATNVTLRSSCHPSSVREPKERRPAATRFPAASSSGGKGWEGRRWGRAGGWKRRPNATILPAILACQAKYRCFNGHESRPRQANLRSDYRCHLWRKFRAFTCLLPAKSG
uniref:Uncharacterized protein n=1 Tax=Oryza nivara TaxID=4536 RepID=A0A0E0GQ42_ORYNI